MALDPTKYPQHIKLAALKGDNDKIGLFLDWLEENNITLAKYENEYELNPLMKSKMDIIGEYLDIDPKALSKEKDLLLEEFTNATK